MNPVTYDFDVITDAPAPKRRLPEAAEKAPQAETEDERRRAALPEHGQRESIQATE
jgi:hypothetical protein